MLDKIALITAATQGIGLETARVLAENGAKVCIASIEDEHAKEAIDGLKKDGLKAEFFKFSALDYAGYDDVVKEIIRKDKKIDILVNNFGLGRPDKDLDVVKGDTQAFFDILHMNIGSVYLLCKLLIPQMIDNGGGSIVNISSVGGIYPDVTRTGYGVSKSAIIHLSKMIAMQYSKNNIRCNCVAPGMIATDAVAKNIDIEYQMTFLKNVPLKRIGKPIDVANAVLFFASDDSNFITGAVQQVAGGYGISDPSVEF